MTFGLQENEMREKATSGGGRENEGEREGEKWKKRECKPPYTERSYVSPHICSGEVSLGLGKISSPPPVYRLWDLKIQKPSVYSWVLIY